MFKRLKNIKSKIKSRFVPRVFVIPIEEFRGENKEMAIARFERENNIKLPPTSKDDIVPTRVFIRVPSTETIIEELRKEKGFSV